MEPALYTTTQTAVIEQLMAELGILLDGIAFHELDGRIYSALVPFGGAARKPLPRWLLPIVSRTSTTLRQRLAAAHAADVSDSSGAVVGEWNERAEDALLERGRAYLVGDLSALSGEQVAGRSTSSFASSRRGSRGTSGSAAGVDAIGQLGLELTRDHGWRVAELMDLFTGLSATTTGPAAAQEELAALVRDEGAAEALLAATRWPTSRSSPRPSPPTCAVPGRLGTAGGALRDRLPDGRRTPGLAAAPAAGGGARPRAPDDLAAAHEAIRLRAEARLIATMGNSSLTRRRLARAQRVFPLREGSEAATIGIPLAGLRRLGLHLGVRLGLYRPDDVFDLTFDEVRGLLRDPGHVDDPASVALQRREEREKVAATPPARGAGDALAGRGRARPPRLSPSRHGEPGRAALVRRAGRPAAGGRSP